MTKKNKNSLHRYVMQRELGGPKKKRLNLIQRRAIELRAQGKFLRPAIRPLGRNMPGGNPFRPITLR